MSRIADFDDLFAQLLAQVREETGGCATIAEAGQNLIEILYKTFSDSMVLARLFVTVPFGKLPAANYAFVKQLAASQDISHLMQEETLVLSLLGTSGANPAWNDRRKSQGHVGIPLASADFIDRIPMMSRLLKEIGLDLDWIDSKDTNLISRSLSGLSGMFYVQDARTAVDQKGRRIIAAQEFVEEYGVRTVFALAGGYLTYKAFVTMIIFCRDELQKTQLSLFAPIIGVFKTNTMSLMSTGSIFG